jgi:hypothetical protein
MNWQDRLKELEEDAPKEGWDNIRESLELDHSGLRKKLLHLESEPPAEAWSGIRKSLQVPRWRPIPRIIPFFRKHAASAAIAASLLLVVYVYLGSADRNPPLAAGLATGMGSALQRKTVDQHESIPLSSQTTAAGNAPGSSEAGTGRPWPSARSVAQPAVIQHSLENEGKTSAYVKGANYIEICDQRGECDRLTYKLEAWAPCLNTSCTDANGGAAERARLIEAWRARLEQSSYVPAAGHFFDIGEMAQLLQTAER